MSRIFLSYRYDVSVTLACALYQQLTSLKHDVCLNIPRLNQTVADPFTLSRIETCSHFVVLLTPSTLKLCTEADDYLRAELETMVKLGRPIILLTTPKFEARDIKRYLPSEVAQRLSTLKPMLLRHEYIDETAAQMQGQWRGAVTATTSSISDEQENKLRDFFVKLPRVTYNELNAQRIFEQALAATQPEESIQFYSQAIAAMPTFAQAYYNRGAIHLSLDRENEAKADFLKAVELSQAYARNNCARPTMPYTKARPAPESSLVQVHPVLQNVEVPIQIVAPIHQPNQLPTVVNAWISHFNNQWPVEITADMILEQVKLRYIANWVVSCGATAQFRAKVITSRRYGMTNYSQVTGSTEAYVMKHWVPNYAATIECGPRNLLVTTHPVELENLMNTEVVPTRIPLNKISADLVKTEAIRPQLRANAENQFTFSRLAELNLHLIQYQNLDLFVALYPIYFSQYNYQGELLQFQIDAVTGSMYGEFPEAFKTPDNRNRR